MSARLSHVLLLVRSVSSSAQFYSKVLNLPIRHQSETWAELACSTAKSSAAAESPGLALKAADCEAACSTGYSPLLSFTVDDLDATVVRALQHGATLDGPIKYPVYGKLAALRAPDGHMLALFEQTAPTSHPA